MSDVTAQPDRYMWAPNELLALYRRIHGCSYGSGLCLPEEERTGVSLLFDQVSATLKLSVVVVLTDEPSEQTSALVYVFFEPVAQVVIALSHTEKKVSISADADMWWPFGSGFRDLTDRAERLLQQGQSAEALVFSMYKLGEILDTAGQEMYLG